MAYLYICEQGATLRKSGARIVVDSHGDQLASLHLFKLKDILIFGNVQITTQAISAILQNNLSVGFMNMAGKLKGKLISAQAKNLPLRQAQFCKFSGTDFCLNWSQSVVKSKVHNLLQLLRRFRYNHPSSIDESATEMIKKLKDKIDSTKTLKSLMGLEGMASKLYFRSFSKLLMGKMDFTNRQKRPAKTPINGLLSLGYTLLTNEIWGVLETIGFDPFLGFYHKQVYGRPALAVDMVEQFRQPVVDQVVLNVVNKKIIRNDDFESGAESETSRLKQEALKKYIRYYENYMMKERARIPAKSFRDLLIKSIYELRSSLLNNKKLECFLMP